jgi:MacB-like periplasmic core domain
MPDWREEIRKRLSSLTLDSTREIDIIEEVSQHLEDRYLELVSGGATDDEARRDVLMELNFENPLTQGRLGVVREAPQGPAISGNSGHNFFPSLWQDLRYASRQVRLNPGFAAVAIVTLALGIGASTAIFSVIDNVVLEPFPYKDAARIVFPRIHGAAQGPEEGRQGFSSDELLAFAGQNHSFEGVVGTSDDPVLYKHGAGVEWLYGADMTPGAFEFFGMPALYGRVFGPEDYKPGAPPVFVMRYKVWKARFNGDPGVLNRTFMLNGTARTLIGIMPPRFGWYDADLWIPKTAHAGVSTAFAGLQERWFILGRLKPGVSTVQAAEDLSVIADHQAKIHPQDYPPQFQVFIARIGHSVTGQFESPLYTVLVAVALLLLIGCVNVANLMLARATSREKEFALRAVLGAGRARLVRLLLVESLVLALGAAALGLLIAWGGLKLIVVTMPPDSIPAESVIGLNALVLAFALVLAVLTLLMFGLAPGSAGGTPRSERSTARFRKRRDRRIPDAAHARCGSGVRSGRVADPVGRRGASDAQFCGSAQRESRIAGGPRLRDNLAVTAGSLQDRRAGEHIFSAAAGACKGDSRGGRCGGVELTATQWRRGQQGRGLRQIARGAMACTGAKH